MDEPKPRCSVCGQGLSLTAPTDRPVKCWLCHEANAKLLEERLQRIENRRKKDEAETRKLNKKKESQAGEGFRQK